MNYHFPRYLDAKKPIDDRALNQYVWDTMHRAVQPATPGESLRILEVGCGIGNLFKRLLTSDFKHELRQSLERNQRGDDLFNPLQYTGIDTDGEAIMLARERFPDLALEKQGSGWQAGFFQADLLSLPPDVISKAPFDLLIAHAVLDLLPLPRALPVLFSYLRPGGIFYFTLNFDGETIFQPEHPLDEPLIAHYHRTMDERVTHGAPSGDSRTGRHLFAHIQNAGGEVLAAGSSDWVVFPGADGYSGDEAYFLHHILHFFEQSLTDQPEIDREALTRWLVLRHEQIERRELVYIAHQLDVVGRVTSG